jgi:Na+/H+-dicarboxylate symporter
MLLSASIALSSILLSLAVALVTSPSIGINVQGGVKKNHISQSQISFNPDGSMHNWEYCPLRAWVKLV